MEIGLLGVMVEGTIRGEVWLVKIGIAVSVEAGVLWRVGDS